MNTALAQLSSALSQDVRPDGEHLQRLAEQLRQSIHHDGATLTEAEVQETVRLYRTLEPESPLRRHLLQALAVEGSEPSLRAFADLLADDPPQRTDDAAVACAPLLQRPTAQMSVLFPRLLDALQRPATAALALDVANHLTRTGILDDHPARPRLNELISLLGGLVEGLRQLEEAPPSGAALQRQRQVSDSVALIAALCEALALVGDRAAVGKLYQVLTLGHRRLRVLAASALARLGEEAGTSALAELASEPVVRSLALAALSELGELDRVDSRFRTPVAQAEGDLASWLAHPARFGMPPAEIELVDATRQPWPGYEKPVDCYLFRYEYRLPRGEFAGIGIAGPVTFSLLSDLEDLTPEEIYAVYAGWSADHPEVSETAAGDLDDDQRGGWNTRRLDLEAEGYSQIELVKLGHFFGENLWVATAHKDGRNGVVIMEDGLPHWFAVPESTRPLGPSEVYWLFIGRRMMRAFQRP